LGYMKDHNTAGFVIYRIALGVVILLLLHFHKINAQNNVQSASVPQAAVIRLASR
jgi:hypothetical protein